MVYFLHKLTFSSSETFLKSITKISCSIETNSSEKLTWYPADRSRHAAGERPFRLFLHNVFIQIPRWRIKTEVFVAEEAVAEGKEASGNGLQG